MSKSVIICKIAYYKAGDKERSSNARHVKYIATKPEADRGNETSLHIGDEDYRPDTAAGHVEYAAERPGSSGLFGPEDQPPDWQEIARELKNHDLPTWRVILSLREDDAVRLELTERRAWEEAVRQAMGDVTKAMHLDPDQAKWVAAFHQKTGHPHAHVMIWENSHPEARRQGLLEPGERKGVFRAFGRELFREERNRLTAEKTAVRDAVRDLARGDAFKAAEIAKDIRNQRLEVQALEGGTAGIQPTLRKLEELSLRLKALAALLPGKGRVALAYMPPEVKEEARQTADWLLAQPGFNQSATRYVDLAKDLASHYSRTADSLEKAGDKAYEDLRDRTAQVILKAAAKLNIEKRNDRLVQERTARTVWRGAWQGVERERLKMEAKAELASMQEAELAEERAKRERNRQSEGRGY